MKGKRAPLVPPEKGQELIGIVMITSGLLLAVSLLTHSPSDPSVLHQVTGEAPPSRNWIGPFGAQLSAIGYGLLGLTALVLPILLLVGGVRRFRGGSSQRIVGRGLGAVVLLTSLPGLLQLTLGRVPWWGGELDAGGAFGSLAAGLLEPRLSYGAFLLLLAAVVIGATLLVQSTLGEALKRALARLRGLRERAVLARSRTLQRREKKKEQEEVAASLREEAVERRRRRTGGALGLPVGEAAPLRVIAKIGEGGFGIRRVRSSTSPPEQAGVAPREASPGALEIARPGDAPARRTAAARPGKKSSPAARAAGRSSARAQPSLPIEAAAPGDLPPVNLLSLDTEESALDESALIERGELIRRRCAEFGVEGRIDGISPGPVITVFEFQPAPGVKVSQIVNLQDDLALALKAESVRIDRLPGRSTLGIEVPNAQRQIIHLGPMLADEAFRRLPSPLTMALGVTIHGKPFYADLATMPHLLVAGATGAGKSVGLQSMITSILYKARAEQVQFIFVDPKRVELGVYKDIPNLRTPVVVEPKQAANVLGNMVVEMEARYRKLAKVHVRNISHYNHAVTDPEHRKRLSVSDDDDPFGDDDFQPLPYYVIIIDELADLMMVASSEVETAIARLAQMARAVGIHLIVATQRPSVDVLTGTIKANFPCRISYATTTRHDSRTILDRVGSEQLLGKGDMLFMPPGTSRVMRLHGAYVSEQETAALVRWLKKQGEPEYDLELLEPVDGGGGRGAGGASDADDALYDDAARLVVAERMGSASFLQRRMRIGFSRASRLIDMMEQDGLLGPPQGSKPREVLVPPDYFSEIDEAQGHV